MRQIIFAILSVVVVYAATSEKDSSNLKDLKISLPSVNSRQGGSDEAEILQSYMPWSMEQGAVRIAKEAMSMYDNFDPEDYEEIAKYIKKGYDAEYGSNWQVIVGQEFGDWVIFNKDMFVKFRAGPARLWVLLFKTPTARELRKKYGRLD